MKLLFTLISTFFVLSMSAQGVKTIPYYMGFENGTTDGIKIFDLNGKTGENGQWKVKTYTGGFMETPYFRSGLSALVYFYDTKRTANDWAVLDSIYMEPGQYSVKFWYCNYSNPGYPHPEKLLLAYGKGQNPLYLSNVITRLEQFDVDVYTESKSVIEIKEAGIYFFGFKAYSEKDQNVICVDDFSIEEYNGEEEEEPSEQLKVNLAWDAEKGLTAGGLTFHTYDTNTYSDAIKASELIIGEDAWNILEIQAHVTLGEGVYACGTSFVDSKSAADRWMVLPEVCVESEDAVLTWMSGSLSMKNLETYNVLVSTEGDVPSSYTTLESVNNEAPLANGITKHSVSLKDYVGKSITLAFQVTTTNGLFCVFDNINLCNGVALASESGVKTVVGQPASESITYNLQGQSVSAPSKGIFIRNGKKIMRY